MNQQNAAFSVELKNSLLTQQNTYNYEVTAVLSGGKTCKAPGIMQILPPVYDCTTARSTMTLLQASREFCLPNGGLSREEILFNAGTEYFGDAPFGCSRSYSLEMTNGNPVPDYFDINSVTGRLTVRISGDYIIDDVIRIKLTDGSHVHRTENIYIMLRCCATSTTVSGPACNTLQ